MENILKRKPDLKADILKVAHHGCEEAYQSNSGFIEAIKPEIAVISVGANHPLGYPHESVIKNLESVKAKIYRTDQNGTVIVKTDGNEYQVETER